MEAYSGDEETHISESDLKLMDVVMRSFESSPQLKSGIPSIIGEIKDRLMHIINSGESIPTPNELFTRAINKQSYSIQSLISAMAVSAIKYDQSTRGKSEPIFKEEVDLMLEREAEISMRELQRCTV